MSLERGAGAELMRLLAHRLRLRAGLANHRCPIPVCGLRIGDLSCVWPALVLPRRWWGSGDGGHLAMSVSLRSFPVAVGVAATAVSNTVAGGRAAWRALAAGSP
jgi:hypothetical protein